MSTKQTQKDLEQLEQFQRQLNKLLIRKIDQEKTQMKEDQE